VLDRSIASRRFTGLWQPAGAEQASGVNSITAVINVWSPVPACHGSKSQPAFLRQRPTTPPDKASISTCRGLARE